MCEVAFFFLQCTDETLQNMWISFSLNEIAHISIFLRLRLLFKEDNYIESLVLLNFICLVIPPLELSSGLNSSVTWGRGIFSTAVMNINAFYDMSSSMSCKKSLTSTEISGTLTPSDLCANLVVHLVNQKPCITCLIGMYLVHVFYFIVLLKFFFLSIVYCMCRIPVQLAVIKPFVHL